MNNSMDLVTFLYALFVGFRPSFYLSDDQGKREADLVSLHVRLRSPSIAAEVKVMFAEITCCGVTATAKLGCWDEMRCCIHHGIAMNALSLLIYIIYQAAVE